MLYEIYKYMKFIYIIKKAYELFYTHFCREIWRTNQEMLLRITFLIKDWSEILLNITVVACCIKV